MARTAIFAAAFLFGISALAKDMRDPAPNDNATRKLERQVERLRQRVEAMAEKSDKLGPKAKQWVKEERRDLERELKRLRRTLGEESKQALADIEQSLKEIQFLLLEKEISDLWYSLPQDSIRAARKAEFLREHRRAAAALASFRAQDDQTYAERIKALDERLSGFRTVVLTFKVR